MAQELHGSIKSKKIFIMIVAMVQFELSEYSTSFVLGKKGIWVKAQLHTGTLCSLYNCMQAGLSSICYTHLPRWAPT